MICLDNTDTLEGGASVTNVVDFTVHGLVGTSFTNIAQGQLSDTDPTVLYTAGAAISIVSVVFVNTHTSAVTVNLYLDPANAGTPRRLIPKNLSLGIGYSMHYDGAKISVSDASGNIQNTINLADIAHGGTGLATITDHSILLGSGADPITPLAVLAAGELVVGVGGADPHALAAGGTTKMLVGGGAADPVWTEATGTGAPVRATSPALVTPALGTPASGVVTNLTGTASGVTAGNVTTNANLTGPITSVGNATSVAAQTGTGSTFVMNTSPTLVTPLLGTPTSGDLQNCTATTTTTKGVVELATVAEAVAGTDTARVVTAEGAHAAIAMDKNPLALAQGIHMIAAASGSNGIAVADNANIDNGTGPFTLSCKRNLASYVVAAILMEKHDDTTGYRFSTVVTTGYLKLEINDTVYTSSAAPAITGGTEHEFTATASPGATNTTVTFYVDGIIVGAAQTDTNETTTDNAAAFYAMGTDAIRTAGIAKGDLVYNRALTAAQVLALYRNGPDFADKWGSQTDLVVSSFANDSYDTFDGASADGFHVVGGAATQYCGTADEIPFVTDIGYRITFTATLTSGEAPSVSVRNALGGSMVGTVTPSTVVAGANTMVVTTTSTTTGVVRFTTGAATEYTIADFTMTRLGATLALEPEGAQPAPGQWLDSSTNKLHAMQPAEGSSLVRPKRDFEIRWTNTWAGTHEAQYIGGVNQAVFPVGCYLTSIIGVVAGATIEDIIVGDGSDTDHWVAVTTGLAAGTTSFTIANAISDATNYKLVVDPDANFTGTIAWTIRGIILQ